MAASIGPDVDRTLLVAALKTAAKLNDLATAIKLKREFC